MVFSACIECLQVIHHQRAGQWELQVNNINTSLDTSMKRYLPVFTKKGVNVLDLIIYPQKLRMQVYGCGVDSFVVELLHADLSAKILAHPEATHSKLHI